MTAYKESLLEMASSADGGNEHAQAALIGIALRNDFTADQISAEETWAGVAQLILREKQPVDDDDILEEEPELVDVGFLYCLETKDGRKLYVPANTIEEALKEYRCWSRRNGEEAPDDPAWIGEAGLIALPDVKHSTEEDH